MFCIDILREVSTYLTVKECLDFEVSLHTKMYEINYYKKKLKYQPYYITNDKYNIIGYYENTFKCDIFTKNYNMKLLSIESISGNFCGDSTKDACIKALDLFDLEIVTYNPHVLRIKN